MATFKTGNSWKFTVQNHSNQEVKYHFNGVTRAVPPGRSEAFSLGKQTEMEIGSTSVLSPGDGSDPQFRLWSGGRDRYINVLGAGGYRVVKDTSEICAAENDRYKITVDGGGTPDPTTESIWFQIYDKDS